MNLFKKLFPILIFALPIAAFAATESKTVFLDGAYSRAFSCNQSVKSVVTFADEPHRLLYAVDIKASRVEWDDVLAIHQTYKDLNAGFENTWQEAQFGQCGCNEKGCSGSTLLNFDRRIFYDTDPPNVDSVTITGEALEKTPSGARGTQLVGFRGPYITATWQLCKRGQITHQGKCKNIELTISASPVECGPNCAPAISWESKYATDVVIAREHDGKQIGSGPVGRVIDSGLRVGENLYILKGKDGFGNTLEREVKVNVISVPPSCKEPTYYTTIDVPITLEAKDGDPIAGYSWITPGGFPSSGNGQSFSVSYNSVGAKNLTVTSGGLNGTCKVNVSSGPPPPSSPVNIKADGSDGPYTLPANKGTFTLSWGAQDGQIPTYHSCKSTGFWAPILPANTPLSPTEVFVVSVLRSNLNQISNYGISCIKSDGTPTSDSVSVIVGPIEGKSCNLSANKSRINVGDSVTWSVNSDPQGYPFDWYGTDNGKNINPIRGGVTPYSEGFTYSNEAVYERWAIVNFPDKTCKTEPIATLEVVSDGGGPGGGGPGGGGGGGEAPLVDIKANYSNGPITSPYNSQALLTWISRNATSCVASASPANSNWTGAKKTNAGAQSTGNLTSNTNFTLSCTGPGGSASDNVTVNVSGGGEILLPTSTSCQPDSPGQFKLCSPVVTCSEGTNVHLSWSPVENKTQAYQVYRVDSNGASYPFGDFTHETSISISQTQGTNYKYYVVTKIKRYDEEEERYRSGSVISNTVSVDNVPYCRGDIGVNAKLDNSSWSGKLNWDLSGPPGTWQNSFNLGAYSVNRVVPSGVNHVPIGQYTLSYQSGGPSNSTFLSIIPSAVQNLLQSLSSPPRIDFIFNFLSNAGLGKPTLNAIPNSGNAPLSGVRLTASVADPPGLNYWYYFFCNSPNAFDPPPSTKNQFPSGVVSGTNQKEVDFPKTCNYVSSGQYTARVAVLHYRADTNPFEPVNTGPFWNPNNWRQTTAAISVASRPTVETPDIKSFTANPRTITRGQSSTLSWSTVAMSSCSIDQGVGGVSVNNSRNVTPQNTITYILTCNPSDGGSLQRRDVTISVNAPSEAESPEIRSFVANPSTITRGQSSTLSWSTVAMSSCSIDQGVGGVSVNNSRNVTPQNTTTFTLSCKPSNKTGDQEKKITVSVNVPSSAPSVDIKANNSDGPITISSDSSVSLFWSSARSSSCTASANPANANWAGSKSISGSRSMGNLTISTIFTISCSGPGGSASDSVTVNVTGGGSPGGSGSGTGPGIVTPGAGISSVDIKANDSDSPTAIPYNSPASLSWTSNNTTSCSASATPANPNWSGSKTVVGSQGTGNLTTNTTFAISCAGPRGSNSDSVVVSVSPPPEPAVDAKVNDSNGLTIPYGSSGKISWSSENATSCEASASPTNSNWSGSLATSGSQSTGSVTTSTTFTITCTGPGGSVSDSVRVNVPPPDFGLGKDKDIFVSIIGTQSVTSNIAKITVSAFDGFTSPVSFSVQSVSPVLNGASFNFGKSSLSAGEYLTGSNFSVTVPASTPPGVYTFNIQGTNGGLVRTIGVRLNVTVRDPSFREI